jgi:hypothetical protein
MFLEEPSENGNRNVRLPEKVACKVASVSQSEKSMSAKIAGFMAVIDKIS